MSQFDKFRLIKREVEDEIKLYLNRLNGWKNEDIYEIIVKEHCDKRSNEETILLYYHFINFERDESIEYNISKIIFDLRKNRELTLPVIIKPNISIELKHKVISILDSKGISPTPKHYDLNNLEIYDSSKDIVIYILNIDDLLHDLRKYIVHTLITLTSIF